MYPVKPPMMFHAVANTAKLRTMTPALSMYGLPAMSGHRASTPATRRMMTVGRSRPGLPPPAAPDCAAVRAARVSETLRKATSEEPVRPDHEGQEQGEIEDGLGPRRAERDLEHHPDDSEDERGERRTGDAAEPADDDDRHERTDPVPVQRGVDRRLQGER